MKKVDSANGKVEFQFCIEVDEQNRITRSVYKNARDEYYLIESEEYHIGSAYDYVNTYYSIDKSEVDFYEKKHHYPIHYVGKDRTRKPYMPSDCRE